MWAEQLALEEEMLTRGVEAYRTRAAKARDKEQMTDLPPFRRLMAELTEVMAPAIRAWVTNAKALKGGPKPIALRFIEAHDPYLCAYITVREVLDRITIQRVGALSVANAIGRALEDEARMTAWQKAGTVTMPDEDGKPVEVEAPLLLEGVNKRLKTQKATGVHRRRVHVNRFNALVKPTTSWTEWSRDEAKHVGLRLIDILCRSTQRFALRLDETHVRRGPRDDPPYILRADDEVLAHLMAATRRSEVTNPQFMPCIMPPKRWEGCRNGAYYSKFLRTPNLIRFSADNEENQGIATDEYDALDMPDVFDAVHHLQETPWMVNKRVLRVVLEVWGNQLELGGLPRLDPEHLPIKPADIDENPDSERQWKRDAAQVYARNAKRVSQAMGARTTIQMAAKFADREIYFPHMLDFRGRMYPIPAYLQPQGTDLARGLLTFAAGRPVGEGGARWLAIHLANCYGNDKVDYDERVQWVENWEPVWREVAKDPINNTQWSQADDPWQTLAAIFEWVRYLDEGPDMVSSLPVRVDGTCNGIQHLAAMMLDEEMGEEVNLTPGNSPRDIYRKVANILQDRLENIVSGGGNPAVLAQRWLDVFGGTVPRTFTKAPVMVTPYGGTREAHFRGVKKWLEKYDPNGTKLPFEFRREAVPWIVGHLGDALEYTVRAALACMEWIKAAAKAVAITEQPLVWITPSGFVVRHFYGTRQTRKIETSIDGRRLQLTDYQRTAKLATREQLQGIAPNLVHSIDAAALVVCIVLMRQKYGPSLPLTAIHDAYGTVAGAMDDLAYTLRDAFVKVHEQRPLEGFRNWCVRLLTDWLCATSPDDAFVAGSRAESLVKLVPSTGSLVLENIRQSPYFFA